MGSVPEGPLVFDAQPLVGLALDERCADAVEERLRIKASAGEVLISSVNWCEVLYASERQLGSHEAALVASRLATSGVVVVDADAALASRAADLKVRFHLGLGDAFAAALSMATGAALVTADPDFLPLAEAGLTIDWLGE